MTFTPLHWTELPPGVCAPLPPFCPSLLLPLPVAPEEEEEDDVKADFAAFFMPLKRPPIRLLAAPDLFEDEVGAAAAEEEVDGP